MSSSRARAIPLLALLCILATPLLARSVAPRSSAVSAGVTVLPFHIIDAEFSTSLNAIVAVRQSPNQLAIYDPETTLSYAVDLPTTPTCVGVSPDGLRAIVGHNGWISEIDLSVRSLVQTLATGVNVTDVIHGGNGYAYVFGTDGYVRTFNLSTGAQTTTSNFRNPAASRLHPALDRIYGADRNTSPDDVIRYNLVNGQAVYAYDSIYHGDYAMCGNVWISADGLRLFTACGNTFRASVDPSLDIRFAGKLSQEGHIQWVMHSAAAGSVAVLPGNAPYSGATDNEIHYYAHESLLYRGKVTMPNFVAEGKSSTSHGRWLFFNAAGTKQYVVVQADSTSGIVNDYGLVTVDCTNATVSLSPSTIEAPGEGGQISLNVTGSAGCVWNANTTADWLQTASSGAGNGTVLVNVRANTTDSPRQETITVGNASATITQPVAAPGTGEPPPLLSTLPFRVTDAEFSPALNSIVAVSDYALNIYNTATRSLTTISLDTAAFCVGVSPDGLYAAVGHSGAISYIDLANAKLVKKLDVSTDVLDIILAGNGYVYAFPRTDQWQKVRCVNIATNTETLQTGNQIYAGTLGRLHPSGTAIYDATNGLSPANIEKLNISGGTASYAYGSPYWGDYSMCGNLWISENGTRIYTACGNVFRSTTDPATDMRYMGRVNEPSIRWAVESTAFGSAAIVPLYNSYNPPPRTDQEIHYYSTDFFNYQGKLVLPSFTVEDKSWQSRGRWHFFSADGTKQHTIVQADPESGMLFDFGITTLDCTGATVTLSSPSASAPADGASLQVTVTGKAGCGWKAATADSWLSTFSSGVGSGTAYITVAVNPTVASRTGSVSIGNQTFTITQSGAGITALNAQAATPTSVSLTWNFSLAPNHYEVWRNTGSGFALLASPQSKSFTDSSAPSGSGVVYRVRAVMNDSSMSSFAFDYAHTFTLTDPSLSGVPIRAVHIEQLRTIVGSLRTIAGLGAASFTDPTLAGVVAKRAHITELRDALNGVRTALGMAPLTFSSLPALSPISAATTQELRNAVQ